jgi:uncharacterized protein (DUF952 family)
MTIKTPTIIRLIKTAVVCKAMRDKVYKIFTESEWKLFLETGQFEGSADDLRDGFIHLSTKDQVAGVVESFFAGKRPLYVAEFSGPDFLQKLTWEASASGGVYPHLYGFDLFASEAGCVAKLQKKLGYMRLEKLFLSKNPINCRPKNINLFNFTATKLTSDSFRSSLAFNVNDSVHVQGCNKVSKDGTKFIYRTFPSYHLQYFF